MKRVLTIAGSDSSGGAGIQADLKTMAAHDVFGMSVIVSVTAQNTMEVRNIQDISKEMIRDQIDCVYEDIGTDAVKIGMLSNHEAMEAVRDGLLKYKPENIVLDPVMYAKHGAPLLAEEEMDALIELVLPLSDLITPNISEAEKLSGIKIENTKDMETAAERIVDLGVKAVLITGGGKMPKAVDVAYDGQFFHRYVSRIIETKNLHGTGCTLSSAIACNLALGYKLEDAIDMSKEYVTKAIASAPDIGKGFGPIDHFANRR